MPLDWKRVLNDVIVVFAGLYPDRDRARLVVRNAGLDPDEIDITGVPKIFWMRIVEEANRRDSIPSLFEVAKQDYPNVNFSRMERELRRPTALPRRSLEDSTWRGPQTVPDRLEKVIGNQPTFLPVSFLETGLERAKAVCRLEGPAGIGSGFLIKQDLLVTNHHVIRSAVDAHQTKAWFNYQKTAGGADTPTSEYELDPESTFVTSPMEDGDDWTVVRIKGNPGATWGSLNLEDVEVRADDFVNIIQHPDGRHKQLAMYHNVVVYADDSRVQYLTDTMPGSSGSPVFDSSWRVVAIHHSGGWIPEPGTKQLFWRNEGIHLRALLKGLREANILDGNVKQRPGGQT